MSQNIYGYARVSSRGQCEDRQTLTMNGVFKIKAKHIFVDKQSGCDFERPAYQELVSRLKKGDLLVVCSIDRLGRNYEEILEQWRIITHEREADIVVLDMPLLDTRQNRDLIGTLISDLVLQLLSFVAQNERENIKKRQQEGICAARLRGVKFGRPTKLEGACAERIYQDWGEKLLTTREASSALGVSRRTLYRWRAQEEL